MKKLLGLSEISIFFVMTLVTVMLLAGSVKCLMGMRPKFVGPGSSQAKQSSPQPNYGSPQKQPITIRPQTPRVESLEDSQTKEIRQMWKEASKESKLQLGPTLERMLGGNPRQTSLTTPNKQTTQQTQKSDEFKQTYKEFTPTKKASPDKDSGQEILNKLLDEQGNVKKDEINKLEANEALTAMKQFRINLETGAMRYTDKGVKFFNELADQYDAKLQEYRTKLNTSENIPFSEKLAYFKALDENSKSPFPKDAQGKTKHLNLPSEVLKRAQEATKNLKNKEERKKANELVEATLGELRAIREQIALELKQSQLDQNQKQKAEEAQKEIDSLIQKLKDLNEDLKDTREDTSSGLQSAYKPEIITGAQAGTVKAQVAQLSQSQPPIPQKIQVLNPSKMQASGSKSITRFMRAPLDENDPKPGSLHSGQNIGDPMKNIEFKPQNPQATIIYPAKQTTITDNLIPKPIDSTTPAQEPQEPADIEKQSIVEPNEPPSDKPDPTKKTDQAQEAQPKKKPRKKTKISQKIINKFQILIIKGDHEEVKNELDNEIDSAKTPEEKVIWIKRKNNFLKALALFAAGVGTGIGIGWLLFDDDDEEEEDEGEGEAAEETATVETSTESVTPVVEIIEAGGGGILEKPALFVPEKIADEEPQPTLAPKQEPVEDPQAEPAVEAEETAMTKEQLAELTAQLLKKMRPQVEEAPQAEVVPRPTIRPEPVAPRPQLTPRQREINIMSEITGSDKPQELLEIMGREELGLTK